MSGYERRDGNVSRRCLKIESDGADVMPDGSSFHNEERPSRNREHRPIQGRSQEFAKWGLKRALGVPRGSRGTAVPQGVHGQNPGGGQGRSSQKPETHAEYSTEHSHIDRHKSRTAQSPIIL